MGGSRPRSAQGPLRASSWRSCWDAPLVTVVTTIGNRLCPRRAETIHFFAGHGRVGSRIHFLIGTKLEPDAELAHGLASSPLIWGTLVIAFGSSVIALPIGLLSAIYLSEYAPPPASGPSSSRPWNFWPAIPDDRLWLSGAILLVTPGPEGAPGTPQGLQVETFNALSACIVVGIMIIPMVSSLSEDVLSAVPRGLREAGYGLGATKFEVSTRIVLPAGLSGVVSSFILAISRAIGETMAVVLAAGLQTATDASTL